MERHFPDLAAVSGDGETCDISEIRQTSVESQDPNTPGMASI